jgi:hypothetical protein
LPALKQFCQARRVVFHEVKMSIKKAGLVMCLFSFTPFLHAQNGFLTHWQQRATATQSKQPAWVPPMVTTYVGLIQVFRTDFTRQIAAKQATTWNYDSSKGVDIIPWAKTEIDVNLPPYLQHSAAGAKNGAGDLSFVLKYRILSGNAGHGNYVFSAILQGAIPTGSYKNGSTEASIGPAVAAGKGFGRLDLQGTLGATLPTSDGDTLGRPVVWNTTAQYHLSRYLWPELESNATYFHGGANDGKSQNFLTPGLVIGKLPLFGSNRASRLGVAFGAAEQIATSRFHTYNHGLLFSGRLLF